MAHTAVTDAGIDQLRPLSRLTNLNVRGTAVTCAGVNRLNPDLYAGSGARPPVVKENVVGGVAFHPTSGCGHGSPARSGC
jgi:hypothetical protein